MKTNVKSINFRQMNYSEETNQVITCRGCQKTDDISEWGSPSDAHKHHEWVRSDAYGLYTGVYCDKCYENNYPYRKDNYYDPGYAGERMDDDY